VPKLGFLAFKRPFLVAVFLIILALFAISFISGALGRSILGDTGLPSWLSVSRPDPHLPPEAVFHLFGLPITNTILASWLSILVLVGISYAVTRRMRLIPKKLQVIFEAVLGWLLKLCQDVAGEENGRRFFPLVATIFLFVIINAWLSLLPGFGSIVITNAHGEAVHLLRGANTDINVPLALALISFAFVEYWGIRSVGGIKYFSKFFNVSRFFKGFGKLFKGKLRAGISSLFNGVIDIFVGILEALSELVRIVSFTFRLFGNMTGGEILLLMMLFLVPWVLAIPFYGLELLVGFVQALIFGGLTLVFATIAVSSPHGEEA